MWVLLNRSFFPDTEAAGEVLTALARSLATDVPLVVVCGFPYGPEGISLQRLYERVDGFTIIRVPHSRFSKHSAAGRLCNWLTYTASATAVALCLRPTGVVIATDPPLLALSALALRWAVDCRMVISCQDLYADAALAVGAVKQGLAARLLDAVTRRGLRSADRVVALTTDMAWRLAAKGVDTNKLTIIRNAADTRALSPVDPSRNRLAETLNPDQRFVLMYAGNVGLAQDWDTLLAALELLEIPACAWRLLVVGDGVRCDWLRERVSATAFAPNVQFVPRVPQHQLDQLLSLGTLHLVPLRRGMIGCVAPSKVYSIMAVGRPYLAISDRECEYARQARDDGCGLWAPANAPGAVAAQIDWAFTHRAELDEMAARARTLAVQQHDVRRNHGAWRSLLRELDHSPSAPENANAECSKTS
jgi:glycosyltransferase involved in cell wall biosynthesis